MKIVVVGGSGRIGGLLQSGYFRAKFAQETLVKDSSVPYTMDPLKTYAVTIDGEVGSVDVQVAQAVQGA